MNIIEEVKPYLFALLQWARARQKFRELWYALIVVGASFAFYGLSDQNAFNVGWREIIAGWWVQARLILAMTQAVSTLSNVAVDAGIVKAGNPLVPVTDSQK